MNRLSLLLWTMSVSLCRLAVNSFRSRALPTVGCALIGTVRQLPPGASLLKSLCVFRNVRTWNRYSITKWIREVTVTIQKRKGPSGKVLFSGALTFLWEKEKIRTEDAISCLKEYDDRVKSLLHMTLEVSTMPSSSSPVSVQGPTTIERHVALFRHELHSHLQQKSEKHLSQLPLLGLRKMGILSRMSMKAHEALRAVAHQAANRLNEYNCMPHLNTSLASNSSMESEQQISCDYDVSEQVALRGQSDTDSDEVCIKDKVSDDGTLLTDSMILYYVNCSNQHLVDMPLVGLRPPGPIFSLSVKIAGFCKRLFGGESNLRSHALFLTHLGLTLCDVTSTSLQPLTLNGLQVSATSLITEGFTTLPMRETLDSAIEQGRALMTICISPHAVLDSVIIHKTDSVTGNEQRYNQQNITALLPLNENEPLCSFVGNTIDRDNIQTDAYLARSGWERFAEAQNCTVYRRNHPSGLYMYKVIGSFSDISVKIFLDVQIDNVCRHQWDGYVEKLETVDVDHETSSEVVHWIMTFPFPMSSREYLYVRRVWINESVAVLINRSVDHPKVPMCRKYVRVQDYDSQTIMQPHTTTDKDGFDFEVTYFDNPQTNLPSSCVNWVATAAMPDFLTKVHAAALQKKRSSFVTDTAPSTL